MEHKWNPPREASNGWYVCTAASPHTTHYLHNDLTINVNATAEGERAKTGRAGYFWSEEEAQRALNMYIEKSSRATKEA